MNDRRRIALGLLIFGCLLALECDNPAGSDGVTPAISPLATLPQPLASDAFNRANENPIAGSWTSGPGNFADLQIVGNVVQSVTPGVDGAAYYNAVVWANDQWSEVQLTGLGVEQGGPAVRLSATAVTGYVFAVDNSGTSYFIAKGVNGNTPILASGAHGFAVGDVLRLEVQGTTLRAYVNGTLLASVVDADIPSGNAGLWIYNHAAAGLAVDNWAGGGFAPAPAPAPPAAPTTLAATAVGTSQINLSWTDNATTEDGFRIERCAGAGCTGFAEIATVGANVVSYQNTGLTASTSYSYRVRAFNAGGTSSYTNTATATTSTTPPSGGPLATDAFNRANENPIAGNWSSVVANLQLLNNAAQAASPNTGVNGVAFYNALTWPADQWSEVTISRLSSTAGDNGPAVRIASGAPTYYYAAVFAGGSLEIYRSINHSWTRLLVAGTAAVGDRVRLEAQGTTLRVYRNGVLLGSVQDTQIATGSAGMGQDGTSGAMDDWAGGGLATGPAPAPPAAPTALAAAAVSTSQINLTWTDNATTEDGFRIERCAGSGCTAFVEIATVGANVVSYQNTGLTASTRYSYRVRAYNAAGTSSYTNTATATTAPSPPPTEPLGRWSPVFPAPIVQLHLHLLPNGRTLSWGLEGAPQVWDPATGGFTAVPAPSLLFCAGHNFLPDGRLLVTGGHISDDHGSPNTNVFDPTTGSWRAGPAMAAGRWYPTNTTLPNGEVLTLAGRDERGNEVTIPEVWNGTAWRRLTGASLALPYYPRTFVAPDGRVFQAGEEQQSRYLSVAGTGRWTNGPMRVGVYRDYGSAVMYQPGRILYVGGGDPPTATAEIIDLNQPSPAWTFTASMAFARRHLNATVLPTGEVLVTGGTSGAGRNNPVGAVHAAELWNPATGKWTTLASNQVIRIYHSTTLLLPDGRVLHTGSGDGAGAANERNYELYSPPYLFRGARPSISGTTPAVVGYGQTVFVETPDAASITKVTFIRLGSVTHAFDMSQLLVPLGFSGAAGGLSIAVPTSRTTAPPGPYMLFLVNGDGVPSEARIMRLQ